ncbi:MAG: hypothetical protein ACP5O4_04640 [bacterium]
MYITGLQVAYYIQLYLNLVELKDKFACMFKLYSFRVISEPSGIESR